MKCPICDIEMRITQREGIEIDYCPQCRGVWLDRGELEKIVARVEGQESRARERHDDDDDDEHDDGYERSRSDVRDSSRRREHESNREDNYQHGRQFRGGDEARYGKHKREGFLSNLFEMFGGD
jgi:Zn-finger nucleic acid-binding protein